jgi:hypothetical protein
MSFFRLGNKAVLRVEFTFSSRQSLFTFTFLLRTKSLLLNLPLA